MKIERRHSHVRQEFLLLLSKLLFVTHTQHTFHSFKITNMKRAHTCGRYYLLRMVRMVENHRAKQKWKNQSTVDLLWHVFGHDGRDNKFETFSLWLLLLLFGSTFEFDIWWTIDWRSHCAFGRIWLMWWQGGVGCGEVKGREMDYSTGSIQFRL